jgi:hypothetical protein
MTEQDDKIIIMQEKSTFSIGACEGYFLRYVRAVCTAPDKYNIFGTPLTKGVRGRRYLLRRLRAD